MSIAVRFCMTQADRIRQFALDHYIQPARAAGSRALIIRAGDVHQAMGLANAMPAVCSAISSNKFREQAGVNLIDRTGPANGANVYFRFSLTNDPLAENPPISPPEPSPQPKRPNADVNLRNALVLVSCVKSKLPHPAAARALYTSAWFRKVRDIVEAGGARWFVLSSLYGLVAPNVEIAPYNYTLKTLGVNERREWAAKVLAQLLPELADTPRVIMFAGERYREFLVEPLLGRGVKVDIPMAHLTRGQQLAWLSDAQ